MRASDVLMATNGQAYMEILQKGRYGGARYHKNALTGAGLVLPSGPVKARPISVAAHWPGGIGGSEARYVMHKVSFDQNPDLPQDDAAFEMLFMRRVLFGATLLHNPRQSDQVRAAAEARTTALERRAARAGKTTLEVLEQQHAKTNTPLGMVAIFESLPSSGQRIGERFATLLVPEGVPAQLALQGLHVASQTGQVAAAQTRLN